MKRPGTERAPEDDELVARRREEILRHAVVHFAHSGYAEADLDALAADVGCAKGTLYRCFHGKEDLFTSSVDLVVRKIGGVLAATFLAIFFVPVFSVLIQRVTELVTGRVAPGSAGTREPGALPAAAGPASSARRTD